MAARALRRLLPALLLLLASQWRRAAAYPAAQWNSLPLWGAMTRATSASPPFRLPQVDGFPCERPYSDDVKFQILVPIVSRASYRHIHYLGMLGLTGAEIYIYLRTDPGDDGQVTIELPCNMTLHERLLLPNQADESAAIFTHVALHYDNLPDALVLLHGGFLHSWHAKCSVAIRRLRAFYRGLAPTASPAMRAFASRAQTINSCTRNGIYQDCCGSLFCRVHTSRSYGELCPWEEVGSVSLRMYGANVTQPLCQLRDRTPDTNWTVLGYDVPDFFVRQSQILRKYEDDPEQLVPITHVPAPRLPPAAVEAAGELLVASEPSASLGAAPSEASALDGTAAGLVDAAQELAFAAAGASPRDAETPGRPSTQAVDESATSRLLASSRKLSAAPDAPAPRDSAALRRLRSRWMVFNSYRQVQKDGETLETTISTVAAGSAAPTAAAATPADVSQTGALTNSAVVRGMADSALGHHHSASSSAIRSVISRLMWRRGEGHGGAEDGGDAPPAGVDAVATAAEDVAGWQGSDDAELLTLIASGGKDGSEQLPSEQLQAPPPGPRKALENAKDLLFPYHRGRDLVPSRDGRDQSHGRNGQILDPIRLWNPYIKAHKILERWTRNPLPGERDQNWASLQPIVPRHVLTNLSKSWWEDTAFLITHVGWRDRDFWTTAWGMMFEWHFWPMIDQRRTNAAALHTYVDIEREMGEDLAMVTCGDGLKDLHVPVPETET